MNHRHNDLFRFMDARHQIYLKRAEGQSKPWTSDPILRGFRFCNVYRELDTVTQWIDKNIRKAYASHDNLWLMLCLARQINWPETLQELIDEGAWPTANKWDWKKARKVMLARQSRGDQLYTGAYMLNAHGATPEDPSDKAFFTCKLVIDSVWQNRHLIIPTLHQKSLRTAWAAFLPYHGWGPFTAYEVVCDLRYTRYLKNAKDINSWANAGPGAIRGLNRVYGRELGYRLKEKQAVGEMQGLLERFTGVWGYAPALEMREIEHSLCEFDKYERVRLGQGRPRSLYDGG